MESVMNIRIDPAKLRNARKLSGKSQAEAAIATGVSKQQISKIETGNGLPSADLLARLCSIYGTPLEQVVTTEVAA
jgi:transcriptional regulator with XRE-family HTH domain